MPEYNFHLGLLRTSKYVCTGNDDYDLIVVIKNSILGWQARKSFREFMRKEISRHSNFKVGYVFSVGQPRESGGRIFNRDGHTFRLYGPAGDLMEKYDGASAEVRKNIIEEADTYGDILLGDYVDTYYNITWKTVTNLRWISAFCDKTHHDTFLFIDDDHRVNISMVMAFLRNTPKWILRRSIFGHVETKEHPVRERSWKCFLSRKEYPMDRYPPFPRGFSQFIGADIIDEMAIASAFTKFNYFPEDVYLGVLGFKLHIDMRNESSMYSHCLYEVYNQAKKPPMVALEKYFNS